MKILLAAGWSWYPSVLIGSGIWTAGYVYYARRAGARRPARRAAFHLGTLLMLLALVSPLDELGDHYLFSAHMVQHLVLIFAVAPLWWLGVSGELLEQAVPRWMQGRLRRIVRPVPAFVVFVLALWTWHIPAVYNLALESEAVHILEHLCFIAAALIGWFPVLGPENAQFARPAAPVRILYLFLLAVPCTALAAMLTFASAPLYSYYASAPHIFGLDALQDQRLGGLLMWLPTHLALLSGIAGTYFAWFARSGDGLGENLQKMGV